MVFWSGALQTVIFGNCKHLRMFAIFLANKKVEDHTGLEDKMSFQSLSGSLQVRAAAQKGNSKKSWSRPLPVVFLFGE